LTRQLVHGLEGLGHTVNLEPAGGPTLDEPAAWFSEQKMRSTNGVAGLDDEFPPRPRCDGNDKGTERS
jgi:hypothetical protein